MAELEKIEDKPENQVVRAAIQADYEKLAYGLAKFIKTAQKRVAEENEKYEEQRQVNKLTLKELQKGLNALKKAARQSEKEALKKPIPEEKKDEEPEVAPVAEEKAYVPDGKIGRAHV